MRKFWKHPTRLEKSLKIRHLERFWRDIGKLIILSSPKPYEILTWNHLEVLKEDLLYVVEHVRKFWKRPTRLEKSMKMRHSKATEDDLEIMEDFEKYFFLCTLACGYSNERGSWIWLIPSEKTNETCNLIQTTILEMSLTRRYLVRSWRTLKNNFFAP